MRPSPPPAQWLNGSPPSRPAGCMRPRPRPAKCTRRRRRRDTPAVAAGGITEQARPDETSGPKPFSRCQRVLDFSQKALRHRHFLHCSQNSAGASTETFSQSPPKSPPSAHLASGGRCTGYAHLGLLRRWRERSSFHSAAQARATLRTPRKVLLLISCASAPRRNSANSRVSRSPS
jgi:hypothetical protein